MKKVFLLIIMILFFPMFVYADDSNLLVKSIGLVKLSENVEELSPANIENNKINLDLKMYEVGDFAEYIVVIENKSDKDLYIEKNLVITESNYFDYELLASDKSTVIEKNSEKEFTLKVKYQNEVPKGNYFSAKYKDISSLAFRFMGGVNPETKRNIILLLIVFLSLLVAFKYNKKSTILLLLFCLGFIPFITQAENNYNIEINSNILIKKVKPNPCTFDGELVQGAEYTNGQYTYRYMQEGRGSYDFFNKKYNYTWNNIENDGWGVILTDKTSEEDVTTKLCTSINDKPIVSMTYMFYGAKTENIDLSTFDTSSVTKMGYMFSEMSSLTSLDLSNFDTSNVTSMSYMFYNDKLEELDLSTFDTSNVIYMTGMFYENKLLKKLYLSHFDTSKVIDMSWMFYNNNLLENIDLSSFDTSNVTNMKDMFHGTSELKTLDLSNFDTLKVTNMQGMFENMVQLKKLDLSSFDTSKVTNMSWMFSNNSNLETIIVNNSFQTNQVETSSYMFSNNIKLVGGNGTIYNNNYQDKTYARIDTFENPGYFTRTS